MKDNNHQFDGNLKRMFQTAFDRPRPEFQDRLVSDVLDEVAAQRKVARQESRTSFRQRLQKVATGWRRRPLVYTGAATAAVLVAAAVWVSMVAGSRGIGQVSCLYGFVTIQNDGASRAVSEATELKSGQQVRTRAGSKAQILLPDKSKLIPEPRTSLHIARTRHGPRITLEQGTVRLEAAKQPAGKAITIEASHAHIKVLGTKLDVRLVEKPSGTQQTRVRVLSGQVELESGGRKVLLLPGTEGVVDENQPPVRASLVFEVNELIGLFNQTSVLAKQSGRAYGPPALIDLTTATVWAVVPSKSLTSTGRGSFSLRLKYPAFRAKAYTLEGAEIPSEGSGQVLNLALSAGASAQLPEYLIIKVPGVGGLLKIAENGCHECSLPGNDTGFSSLLQFHLPEWAQIQNLQPAGIGTSIERNKLILTVAANAQAPQVLE